MEFSSGFQGSLGSPLDGSTVVVEDLPMKLWETATAALSPNGTVTFNGFSTLLGAGLSSQHAILTTLLNLASAMVRPYLQNDYFAGGLGLMVLGFLSGLLNRQWRALLSLFTCRARGMVTLHIKPEDSSHQWLLDWLSDHASKDASQLALTTRWEQEGGDNQEENQFQFQPTALMLGTEDSTQTGTGPSSSGDFFASGKPRPRLLYTPQLIEAREIPFQGHKITFQVKRALGPANKGEPDGRDLSALLAASAGREELVLEASSRSILESLVQAAMDEYHAKQEQQGVRTTVVRRWSSNDWYWSPVATKRARPLDSVILDCDAASLLSDARSFFCASSWYADRGIPHRRGFLLHGPPGCGKSSLIAALAGELGMEVATIGLSARDMNDEMLHTALSRVESNCILVLEDVDVAFASRQHKKSSSAPAPDSELSDMLEGTLRLGGSNAVEGGSLSFSGLLNALDGIAAQEGRLLVMTTNHLEKLDPALIRPGRVDVRMFLGYASSGQVERMFRRFYPDAGEEVVEAFVQGVPHGLLSPACLQGHFLVHRESAEQAVEGLQALVEEEEKKERKNKEASKAEEKREEGGDVEGGEKKGDGGEADSRRELEETDKNAAGLMVQVSGGGVGAAWAKALGSGVCLMLLLQQFWRQHR